MHRSCSRSTQKDKKGREMLKQCQVGSRSFGIRLVICIWLVFGLGLKEALASDLQRERSTSLSSELLEADTLLASISKDLRALKFMSRDRANKIENLRKMGSELLLQLREIQTMNEEAGCRLVLLDATREFLARLKALNKYNLRALKPSMIDLLDILFEEGFFSPTCSQDLALSFSALLDS